MRILILGATGAAGGSLLDEALVDPRVTELRAIARRPLSVTNAKLRVQLLDTFDRLPDVAGTFAGLDACFYCVGRATSQIALDAEYRRLAVDLPLLAARLLREQSPHAVFHYLSGQGAATDSRQRWARTKFEAEQLLRAQSGAVCWRPGAIDATRQEGWPWHYRIVIPALRWLLPLRSVYVRGSDLARAMLNAAAAGSRNQVYENRAIRDLAGRHAP
jgi:uncharacterized protein YbjT (DUF2867 family)